MEKKLIFLGIVAVGLFWIKGVLCQDSVPPKVLENTALSNTTVSAAIADDEKHKIAKDYVITLPLPVLDTNIDLSEEALG